MTLFDYLTLKSDTSYITENQTLRQVLEKFDAHNMPALPILDTEGKYLGAVSEGDILRYIKNSLKFDMERAETTRVTEIEILKSYKALSIASTKEDMFNLALTQNLIPVIDGRGIFIGIINRQDILKSLAKGN